MKRLVEKKLLLKKELLEDVKKKNIIGGAVLVINKDSSIFIYEGVDQNLKK